MPVQFGMEDDIFLNILFQPQWEITSTSTGDDLDGRQPHRETTMMGENLDSDDLEGDDLNSGRPQWGMTSTGNDLDGGGP